MMYQVIARKFRPQSFKEMLGQEPLVTTLKNQLKTQRLPHAYLFSGPRGTGKTSIARLLAKAINCENRDQDEEPCNKCSSCLEIQSGSSMDILEIDGASNRGIDDIRKINETVGFTSLSGRYKIYIIDEVHMLTKEAFNALLKTLEEPPPKVKFFFATTEVHKVLPTILSRCQRFQLNRIPLKAIVQKLTSIAAELNFEVEEEAFLLIAKRAEGGLRDAESLFDQILSFQEGKITAAITADLLGVPSKEFLFQLDLAVKEENYAGVQKIAEQVFLEGKDLTCFYDSLLDHFRTLLLTKLQAAFSLPLGEGELKRYEENHLIFTKESLMAILDFLLDVQTKVRTQPITQTSLEQTLYKILRLSKLESISDLMRKLNHLEARLGGAPSNFGVPSSPLPSTFKPTTTLAVNPSSTSKQVASPISPPMPTQVITPSIEKPSFQPPQIIQPVIKQEKPVQMPAASVTIDPTPTAADLKGTKPALKTASKVEAKKEVAKTAEAALVNKGPAPVHTAKTDTLIQFAAIELEGKISKK